MTRSYRGLAVALSARATLFTLAAPALADGMAITERSCRKGGSGSEGEGRASESGEASPKKLTLPGFGWAREILIEQRRAEKEGPVRGHGDPAGAGTA